VDAIGCRSEKGTNYDQDDRHRRQWHSRAMDGKYRAQGELSVFGLKFLYATAFKPNGA